MSYDRKPFQFAISNGSAVLIPDVLSATGVHGEYICVKQFDLNRLLAVVTTAVVSTTAVQVDFKLRLSPGTTAGQVIVGSLLIPGGTALGVEVYKDIDPVKVMPGQTIAFEVAAAASASGGAVYFFEVMDHPEQPANLASMLASA